MSKPADATRRDFLSTTSRAVVGGSLLSISSSTAGEFSHTPGSSVPAPRDKSAQPISEFHFGASVYPELQTRKEWNSMLDHFQRAHMNCVRVSESSWGNIQRGPERFEFAWLHEFLDDLQKRQMRAILGTGSYVPPQWLLAAHPEILIQLHPGVKAHTMARHAPCLNHPLYRDEVRRYILRFAKEFKGHPTVVGWQLGNEEEGELEVLCYNPACESAWRKWLVKTYHTPDELNRRLNLVSWGMKVDSFDTVLRPNEGVEESGTALAALTLAFRHFKRDVLLDFFRMQASSLREAGVEQWILTDWNTQWHAVADDPQAAESMDIAGLNEYQHPNSDSDFWLNFTWQQDMHRSCYGRTHFITTENRFGAIDKGGAMIEDAAPTREQFLVWGLETAAIGTCGLFYWSGNRWRGGHWPHWGGLLDWSGHPEPDFEWAVELGAILSKWGSALIQNPVKASAAVLTDFDQRAALAVYPHVSDSQILLPECFGALHRLGVGVDSMNLARAASPENLRKYSVVLIPAATALNDPKVTASLMEYVQGGGVVLITPFTSYMDADGIFRGDGFGANLWNLTRCVVRTVRLMGNSWGKSKSSSSESVHDLFVEWRGGGMRGNSAVGLNGFVEFLEADAAAETVATFTCSQKILDGHPAAVQRRLGRGAVVKLGFWPDDDSLVQLIAKFVPERTKLLTSALSPGALAVPRTDGSIFIVNTSAIETPVELARDAHDRLSGKLVSAKATLKPYEAWWLM